MSKKNKSLEEAIDKAVGDAKVEPRVAYKQLVKEYDQTMRVMEVFKKNFEEGNLLLAKLRGKQEILIEHFGINHDEIVAEIKKEAAENKAAAEAKAKAAPTPAK